MTDLAPESRYLPAEGQESTHVASLSGHAAQVEAVDPTDGKKGTKLPRHLVKDALLAGCRAIVLTEAEASPVKRSARTPIKPTEEQAE